jgi:hypothetical protein
MNIAIIIIDGISCRNDLVVRGNASSIVRPHSSNTTDRAQNAARIDLLDVNVLDIREYVGHFMYESGCIGGVVTF